MAKYKHVCERCGEEFEDYFATTRFCSRSCYNQHKKASTKYGNIVCPICGSEFKQTREGHMFCSIACRVKSTEKKVNCICECCGKTFQRIQSEVDKNVHHYCSVECKRKAMYWSDEDTQKLRDNFGILAYKEMESLFNPPKTADEIKRRAIYIGLTSSPFWSDEEIQTLVNNYPYKPLDEIMKLLPNRTQSAILGQAKVQNIKSYFYLNRLYTDADVEYLRNNYLEKSNEEMAKELNRTAGGIAQRLFILDLHRPTEINNYKNLICYVRQRLVPWRDRVRRERNYVCEITGRRSNIVVHHIRGFNLLFNETVHRLNFSLRDDMSHYTQDQLDKFMDAFVTIQESYGQYICINEEVHKEFHNLYGYGDNTQEQWNDFISKYYT